MSAGGRGVSGPVGAASREPGAIGVGARGLLRKPPTLPGVVPMPDRAEVAAAASCDDMRTDAVQDDRAQETDTSLRIDLDDLQMRDPGGVASLEDAGGRPSAREPAFTGRRAFLLRRLVVDLLPGRLGERHAAAAFALLADLGRDPSEHVRIGLCRAAGLLAAGGRFTAGDAVLTGLADPLREPSPAVRAAALRCAAPPLDPPCSNIFPNTIRGTDWRLSPEFACLKLVNETHGITE